MLYEEDAVVKMVPFPNPISNAGELIAENDGELITENDSELIAENDGELIAKNYKVA